LPSIKSINLANNNFNGVFPRGINRVVTTLQELHLSNNDLYGPLPSELSYMDLLATLNVDGNQLTGVIPDLPSILINVNFNGNNFACPVPNGVNATCNYCNEAGTYPQDTKCIKCPAGTYSNGKQCLSCPENTFSLPASSFCNSCPSNTYSSTSSSVCLTKFDQASNFLQYIEVILMVVLVFVVIYMLVVIIDIRKNSVKIYSDPLIN